MCELAIKVEMQCQEHIKTVICKRISEDQSMNTPYLQTLEKNLLTLASYEDYTNGILYAMPIVLDLDSENKILYVRYIQHLFLLIFYKTLLFFFFLYL